VGEGIKPIGDESQFGDEWLKKCRKEASNIDKAKFTELGEKLRVFAEPYSNQIASLSSKFPNGPANIDLPDQLNWLEEQVLTPIARLEAALQSEKRHYFKSVMFDHSSVEPDLDKILDLLGELHNYAEAAFIEIDQQTYHRIQNTTQLQLEIVIGLVAIIDEKLPELRKNRMSDKFKELVRISFHQITRWHKQLDDEIKIAVKRVKHNSGGNES
jgi:hypothetical protein